jgi:hypothetical protein
MSNQDLDGNGNVDQWNNGTDVAAEINRMMNVRRAGLERFGENGHQGGPANGGDRGCLRAALSASSVRRGFRGHRAWRPGLHLCDARRWQDTDAMDVGPLSRGTRSLR